MPDCVGAYCPPPPPPAPPPPPDYTWVLTFGVIATLIVVSILAVVVLRRLYDRRKAQRQALLERAERQSNEIASGNMNAIFGDYRPADLDWESK